MENLKTEQTINQSDRQPRERLLGLLAAATFLIFFQAYMVAPLIPRLATVFDVSIEKAGFIVPAYLIPYGIATLFYGLLSDRIGRRPIMFASFAAFVVLTGITGFVRSADEMTLLRILTGLGASGVVPLALALVGDLYPFRERGRPLGWLFGAMAGGMAIGSTVGVILEPFISWRGLFFGTSALGAIVLLGLLPFKSLIGGAAANTANGVKPSLGAILSAYKSLLSTARGARTYLYVFINAVFHSGIFTWLGFYFAQRYGLGEIGIGLALLGYGIPGFLLGPVIGRLADRFGRNRLIPIGLLIAGASAAALALDLPLIAAALLVTLLSLGYDLTQPLLAGIVTDLGQQRGQAMGLNVFILFVGFGIGSLVFSRALGFGINAALVAFGALALLAGTVAIRLFYSETPATKNA